MGMIDRLVEASLRKRAVVLFGVLVLVALGAWAVLRVPIDAFPDEPVHFLEEAAIERDGDLGFGHVVSFGITISHTIGPVKPAQRNAHSK